MKTFNDLRKLDVGEHIEKKNGLSYLSWSWAVDVLLQNDPSATWEFPEPKYYGDTVMVYCDVTAFGKTMKMHLPVMDLRNKAIVNPNTTDINKAMMRCLAKCIACFGIGLYIFSGEDLPTESVEDQEISLKSLDPFIAHIQQSMNLNELKVLWQDAINACGNSLDLKKMINETVKIRKAELEKSA
jgi:hypothetical protein